MSRVRMHGRKIGAMFKKTEENTAAEEAQKQAADETQRQAAEAAEQSVRRRVCCLAGRPGNDRSKQGQQLFQIRLPLAEMGGNTSYFGSSDNKLKASIQNSVLDEIEKVGWRLEQAEAVLPRPAHEQQPGSLDGEGTVTRGTIFGLYIFRAT